MKFILGVHEYTSTVDTMTFMKILICVSHAIAILAIILNGRYDIPSYVMACIGIIPHAKVIGDMTKLLEPFVGTIWAAFLNAAFGNAAELFVCIFGVINYQDEFVVNTIAGGIVSNVLLVLGITIFFGSWKNRTQVFRKDIKSLHVSGATTLILITTVFILTSISTYLNSLGKISNQNEIHICAAVLLILIYIGHLFFTIKHGNPESPSTPKESVVQNNIQPDMIININSEHQIHIHMQTSQPVTVNKAIKLSLWESFLKSKWYPIIMLAYSCTIIGFLADIITGNLTNIVGGKLSQNFIGFAIVSLLGNISEFTSAVKSAMNENIDIAIQIPLSSALQLTFLLAISVMISLYRSSLFLLSFNPIVGCALFFGPTLAWKVLSDGETSIIEGGMLVVLYILIDFMVYGYTG
jgi:Ca2+:H+ antiporter